VSQNMHKRRNSVRYPRFTGLRAASEASARAKRANRKGDSRHEVLLRREIWRLGLRFRKHIAELPGVPDIVFRRARVVVFCDGDFWHGRNWRKLQAELRRRHNAPYWIAKIAQNRKRDRQQTALLTKCGWLVLRFWESDILKSPNSVAA